MDLLYDLNFFALGTFSPLNSLSAPTFLPLLGHPYLGGNNLSQSLQELSASDPVSNSNSNLRFITIVKI